MAEAIASTCATVGGITSSSGIGGSVIGLQGLAAMTLSSTAAVRLLQHSGLLRTPVGCLTAARAPA